MTMHLYQSVKSNEFESLVVGALGGARTSSVYRSVAKRALDIVLVLLASVPALMIVLPFVLLVALDGRSPFYRQRRVGRNGAVFNMWKLRSMVPNADQMLEGYLAANPAARSEWDLTQKLRHDPRITKVGHIIRKSSIDELPQLWNVLKGDMSIVGPRPMMVDQQKIYPGTAYYALRPGITGFWQTSVRNESSFADRAQFDTDYLRQMSFLTDFRVMLRTVRVVVNGTGC
jgi:lipopolysaccharide/colanic/teichoic acid biosynthesis glycosyltransferase